MRTPPLLALAIGLALIAAGVAQEGPAAMTAIQRLLYFTLGLLAGALLPVLLFAGLVLRRGRGR